MPKAIVTGTLGQDAMHLVPQLLADGYEVVGIARRSSANESRLEKSPLGREASFRLVTGDVTDAAFLSRLLAAERPSEVYNLACPSHVGHSFTDPAANWAATYGGCLNCLEAIRALPESLRPRFYQASSSEMFGSSFSYLLEGERGEGIWGEGSAGWQEGSGATLFQDEKTPFRPNSPYAVAKLAAHHLVRVYSESYGVFACSGILFNHESRWRGTEFVTAKIARHVGRLRLWKSGKGAKPPLLRLGNLDARRDWGHAGDYCRAMRLMIREANPDDFVVATGETRSVRDFLEAAFAWADEKREDWVEPAADPAMLRPCEVPYLRGCARKAERLLGWRPAATFEGLVAEMCSHWGAEAAP